MNTESGAALREEIVVKEARALAPGIYELRARAPRIAAAARPGQFAHLRIEEGNDPFLRRPLSIGDVAGEEVFFCFRVVGRGTERLSRVQPGRALDTLGPLGNPFTLHADRPALFVAGGLGAADFPFLARRLRESGVREMRMLYGARTAGELIWRDRLEALGVEIHAATDDGSAGHTGICTDPLPGFLERFSAPPAIYACGPEPMFEALLARVADPSLSLQLAFEQRMGCGIGACLACAVKTNRGYLRACREGPGLDGALFRPPHNI